MPTRYFPDEGETAGYLCPECSSSDIKCIQAVYEFTTLECSKCGYRETVDDLQITRWFAPEN